MRRRGRVRMLGLAAVSVLIGIVLTLALAIGGRSEAPPPAVPVQYRLGVDDADVIVTDSGWTVTNDLGDEITVESYVVSTWSATAQACAEQAGDALTPSSLLSVGGASASHSGPPDPAQGNGPTPQVLGPDEPTIDFDTATVTADTVCTTHIAVAAGEGTSTGRTEPTIEVSGTYRPVGADDVVAFSSAPTQGWGGIVDLDRADLDAGGAEITIVRRLAQLFDNVDLTADQDDLDTALLQALTEATVIRVSTPEA